MHIDALKPGARVLLIDDLLATGGTAAAAVALMEKLNAKILEAGFLIELKFLNGREKLTLPSVPSWFIEVEPPSSRSEMNPSPIASRHPLHPMGEGTRRRNASRFP